MKFYEISREALKHERVEAMIPYSDMSNRGKSGRVAIVNDWFNLACQVMAPYESKVIKSDVLKRNGCHQQDETPKLDRVMSRLVC